MTYTGPNGWLRAHTDKVGITQPFKVESVSFLEPGQRPAFEREIMRCDCQPVRADKFTFTHAPNCRTLGARATGTWKVWAVVITLGAIIGTILAFLLPWPTP